MNLNQQEMKETFIRALKQLFWRGGLVGLFLGGFAATAAADDLQKTSEKITRMERQMRVFLQSYSNINLRRSIVSLRKRLADGQLNYLLKDYVRASIILFDAVENNKNDRSIAWYEAVFYLAESLYRNRNYQSAATHYQKLVVDKRRHYDQALIRLMEIAEKTNRYKWLNNYFQQGTALPPGPLRDKIVYLRGKGLYRQKKYSAAQQEFAKIPQGREWARSQYFLAVLKLQTESRASSIPAAISMLQSASRSLSESRFKQKKLQDVILISLGRLHLEKKSLKLALEYYQKIGRKSHIFDQALYEICWTYIRRAQQKKKFSKKQVEYKRALRALDLLLAFLPDSPFHPKAQLLRSHLLLRLSKYNSAMGNYQKIVKRYSSVHKEMNTLLTQWTNPLHVFESLIAQNLDKFNVSSVLPKDAVRWMSNEDLMKRTLGMLRDLREMNAHLSDSQSIIQKLESALQVQDRIALSPALKEGRLRALSMRSELIQIQEKLNAEERQLLFSKVPLNQQERYKQIKERLKTMQTLFQQTPQNRKELLRRAQSTQNRLQNLQARLHKLTLQFDYNTRFISAARNWLSTDPEAQKLTPNQRNKLSSEVSEVDRRNEELKLKRKQLKRTLDLAQVQFGNISVGPQEERIQQRYKQLLTEERQLLRQMQGSLSPSERDTLSNLRRETNRVRRLQKQLREFFKLLSGLISRYSIRMQQKVQEEKIKVGRYEQQVTNLRGRAKRLASQIAYNTFLTVRKKFRDLVLRADVGVIDVVWQEKQTTQNQIRKLSKERNSELRVLDSEFRDLLQEVK